MVGLAGELVKGGKFICFCFQGLDMSYHLKLSAKDVFFLSLISVWCSLSPARQVQCFLR